MRAILQLPKLIFWKYLRHVVAAVSPRNLDRFSRLAAGFQMRIGGPKRFIMAEELVKSGLADEGDADRLVRESFAAHIGSWARMCYLGKMKPDTIESYTELQGREFLDQALAGGKGAILLNPHFGPFLLMMAALGHRGYKTNQVTLQGEPPVGRRTGMARMIYEAKFEAIEKQLPATFINAAASNMAIRDVMRALERNEVVLFASTGRAGKAWHQVKFLGREATFNVIPFKVAASSGAPLLPVFAINGAPRLTMAIEKPLVSAGLKSPEEMVGEYAGILEACARKRPDHFAAYLCDMHMQAHWDDHPFFGDYPPRQREAAREP